MPVARWPVNRDAGIKKPLAQRIDIVDGVGEMPEIAALVIGLRVPVPGQFDLRVFVARRGQEDEREAPLFILVPP
jgi:hypothetical protein